MQYAGVVYPGRVAPLQSISLKISYIIEQSGVGNVMETQTASLSARPRKRHPSPDHVGATHTCHQSQGTEYPLAYSTF